VATPRTLSAIVLPDAGTLKKGGAKGVTRKLYRSKTNRQLAGVCGGLAEHFNLDATLIRGAVRRADGTRWLRSGALCGHVDHHPQGAVNCGGAVSRRGSCLEQADA
jgi:hypothetical protein